MLSDCIDSSTTAGKHHITTPPSECSGHTGQSRKGRHAPGSGVYSFATLALAFLKNEVIWLDSLTGPSYSDHCLAFGVFSATFLDCGVLLLCEST